MRERELDRTSLGDHIDRLYRAAWALCGSREEAEDLVQDTLARVLARPRFLRSQDDLGYLLRALRNTLASERRRLRRRPTTEPLADEAEVADQPSLETEEVVEARLVYGAIAGLGKDFREVLVAIDVVGLSYKEAAHALKLPEGTVMSRLFRARQQVARALDASRAASAR
jgi:RNA polymerase sigma-70 factor (ECF subfamily)